MVLPAKYEDVFFVVLAEEYEAKFLVVLAEEYEDGIFVVLAGEYGDGVLVLLAEGYSGGHGACGGSWVIGLCCKSLIMIFSDIDWPSHGFRTISRLGGVG